MTALAVDESRHCLNSLMEMLQANRKISRVYGFTDPCEAVEWFENNEPDIAFIGAVMNGMTGLEVARCLRDSYFSCPVVMISDNSEAAEEAMGLNVCEYLVKPVDQHTIDRAIVRACSSRLVGINALIVERDELCAGMMVDLLGNIKNIRTVKTVPDVETALQWLEDNTPDIAFVDELPSEKVQGTEIISRLKSNHPEAYAVLISCDSESAATAYRYNADGFLRKPVSKEAVYAQLLDSEHKAHSRRDNPPRLMAKCFGNFEVYYMTGGTKYPVIFRHIKTKELLAYLVNRRGAGVTNGEIAGALYEDREWGDSLKSNVRNLKCDLTNTLKGIGFSAAIHKRYNEIGVNVQFFDCDYYWYLDGDDLAAKAFTGEYMAQYSWAEETTATLCMAL